ncbi:Fe-S cluster assembly protein SufD [soil metagenome]
MSEPTFGPFTASAAAALAGPAWLRTRRTAAAERAEAAGLPSTDEEVWRYSRVADLDLGAYRPVADGSRPAEPTAAPVLADVTTRAGTVVVVDGRIAHVELDRRWVDRGVVLGALADAPDGADALGSVAARAPDVFAELNTAYGTDPVLLRVPAGVTLDAPVVISHQVSADGAATFPRLVVQAGADSEVAVVDHHGSTDVAALVLPVIELDAGPAARLRYLHVQELGPRVWQIASQVSRVGQDATLVAASAALGGDYARLRADCRLEGRGATGDLLSVYFGEDHQTLDFRTFQDHRAPDTTSNLLFKGAVGGHSRSVYTGLIRVRKEAHGTNAFQTNRNIKLSDHAWAESVPNLEIENNDVRCSHASAVGPIDPEQRFYLESRGVPPEVAERLVVAGFFAEVLAQFPIEALAPALAARISEKLERGYELS